jgi:hypothetical protein
LSSYPITFQISVEGAEDAAASFSQVGDSVQSANEPIASVSRNTDNATQSFSKTIGPIAGTAAAFGSVAGSAYGLSDAYTRLEDSNLKLQNANDNLTKAQTAYNDAVAKYGPDSTQAANAALNLQKAHDNLTIAQNNAQMAGDRINQQWIGMATSTIPMVLMNVGNFSSTFSTLKDTLGGVFQSIGGGSDVMAAETDTSFSEMGATAEATGETMDAIPIIAIIGGIILAVTLLYAAWQSNFGGIRTYVTEFWNDVKPIFNDIGSALTFIWNNVLKPLATNWENTWNGMNAVFQAVSGAISGGIKSFINDVITTFNDFITGINLIISGINAVAGLLHLGSLSTFSTIPTLASGGVTSGPGLFMAGEAGPELLAGASVTPLSSSSTTTTTTRISAQQCRTGKNSSRLRH